MSALKKRKAAPKAAPRKEKAPPKSLKVRTRIGHQTKLNTHYLEIPASAIAAFGGKFSRRFVCRVNGKLTFQGGLVALGGGKGYITLSKARMKELGVKSGDAVSLELSLDRSKFGMEYPEELRALFAQDPEGKKRFSELPPGKQRYIVYYVGLVKNTDSRLERALFLIENLKRSPNANPSFRVILGKGERPV